MKKKILLIDDEVDFCFFLGKNLEASGEFEVLTSNNGADGIEAAKAGRPDLILLDVMMPGLSGSEVAAELKKEEATKNIPIVFLTAIIQEEEARQNRNVIGGWHYVPKPVKLDELVKLINELIK